MPGPTQDLINRCYAILARCDHFSSLQHLKAVFVSKELLPFRDRLRDAPSVDERIRLNVDYLLYQKTSDGHLVFTLFLEALRPSSPTDALYGEFEALRAEFEQSLGQVSRLAVPYVVAAMTRQEAESLLRGDVFQDPTVASIEQSRFKTLLPVLPEHWLEDYGTQRDEWKLHADHSSVIGAVLDDALAQINLCMRQPQGLPVLDGISLSEAFFSSEQQGEAWEELRQSGGLLIVDAVSLFCPPIRKALKDSELLSNEHIAVLVLSPFDFHVAPVNQHITELVRQEMKSAYFRYEDLDHRYEMGIGDLCGIQRWLFMLFSKPEDMAEVIQQRKVELNRRRIRGQGITGRMPGIIFRQSEVER